MSPTTRLLLPLCALMLLAGGCFAFGPRVVRVPDAPSRVESDMDAIAYLRLESGSTATVTRDEEVQAGQDGAELLAGDRITVLTGTAVISYPGAGASHLDEGTSVVLLADGEDGTVFTELQLMAGSVWTRFEKLFGPNESFSVNANGVVATVRGTAFGVSMENGMVDVQVADHEVDVTSEELQIRKDRKEAKVLLKAGSGLRLTASEMSELKETGMKKRIRLLTASEKQKVGYVFMAKQLDVKMKERPAKTVKLKGAGNIPQMFENRMDFLKEHVKLEAVLRGFILPTRSILPGEIAPTDPNPSIEGPTTTTFIESSATLEIR